MGLIISPFIIGAFAIIVFAIKKSYRLWSSGTIGLLEIGIGITLSLALFGVIVLRYVMKGKYWALSPFFIFPIFTVIIPFIIYIVMTNISFLRFDYISNLLLVSLSITGILSIAYDYIFSWLMDYFNIQTTY